MTLLQLPLSFSYKFFFNAQGPNLTDKILWCQSFPIFDPLSPLSSLDPIKSSHNLKLEPKNIKKKHRKGLRFREWELNQVFQEMWVVILAWVEVNGKV
jgi:hypothetical protein